MGQFTKPTFKGLILTVIWGNTIVIIVVVVVSFAATGLQVRRALGAEGHVQGHIAGEQCLGQDCPRTLLLCSAFPSVLSSPAGILNGAGDRAPRGKNLVLGGAKKKKKILTFLMYKAQIYKQYINR